MASCLPRMPSFNSELERVFDLFLDHPKASLLLYVLTLWFFYLPTLDGLQDVCCLTPPLRIFLILGVPAGVWATVFKSQLKKLKPYSFVMTIANDGKKAEAFSRPSEEPKDFSELTRPNSIILYMHYLALRIFLTAMVLTAAIDAYLLFATIISLLYLIPTLS